MNIFCALIHINGLGLYCSLKEGGGVKSDHKFTRSISPARIGARSICNIQIIIIEVSQAQDTGVAVGAGGMADQGSN